MNLPARQQAAFATANPHALATILEASQTKSIIASSDIFDISGTKLWARDQPVSVALQRKLLDRQLRNPLESCLLAEDGVTAQTLLQGLRRLVEGTTPLASVLRPHAALLVREVPHLPLHSVVQLLLTAGQATRADSFEHALQGMALAGALMAAHGGTTAELRLAMLCGLMHDLGEMYIAPHHGEADADRALDVQSYQHLVVHPHVGQLLLAQLTNYPAAMARAIGEHLERLDGSGYPHGLQRDAVSPLGRLLAVTDAALAVLRGERASLGRVSVALRVVPGEFDLSWVGRITEAARGEPELQASRKTADSRMRLARLDAALQSAQDGVEAAKAGTEAPALVDALGLGQHLLGRLRTGWYASGLWSSDVFGNAHDTAEVEVVEDELFFRLQGIERALRLRAGALPAADAQALERLCEDLRAYSAPR
jgi:hypothetical protein